MANRKLYRILKKIKQEQPAVRALSDKELSGKTGEFRMRIAQGASVDSLLPEAFAVVCEADRRILRTIARFWGALRCITVTWRR